MSFGACERLGELVDLIEVLADHEDALALVLRHELAHDAQLGRSRRRQAVPLVVGARGVLEPLLGGQVDADLVAGCGGDEALRLDLLPRGVEALGTDEREHVGLAAVLADERRGEAEATPRLQLGGQLEDRGGEQVHLVVDDEAPVEGVEQGEVGVLALPLRGEDLVGRDRDRLDLLDRTRVLAHLILGQRRALQQLAAPLPCAHGVGHEDQGRGVGLRHRPGADERLARAAGQHDDAGAAGEEVVDRLLLVVAQVPVVLDQVDLVRGAGRVAGGVLGGPAELEQLLLDLAARPGHQRPLGGRASHAEELADLGAARDLGEHRGIRRCDQQLARQSPSSERERA